MNNLIRFSSSIMNKSKMITNHRLLSQVKMTSSHAKTTKNDSREEADIEENAPIKYTSSPAYKWAAKSSRTGVSVPRLWYEPLVILSSLAVFMIYFFILREENHIDKELEKTLYSRIKGLEEHQLRASLEYNRLHSLNTVDIETRLAELERKKQNIS